MNWPQEFVNKIICGGCLSVMEDIPNNSIDMAMTSPPYWGLRDYGIEQIFGGDKDCEHKWGERIIRRTFGNVGVHPNVGNQKIDAMKGHENKGQFCLACDAWRGQIGLEPTPEMYIDHLVQIFNELKRILKREGTLWLNMGDTYSSTRWSDSPSTTGISKKHCDVVLHKQHDLPSKCLCMIPERLSWSLIQNGWILRNKNIWHKRNAMPSSVKDRFNNRWEYLFMFTKNNKTILWHNDKTKEWVKKRPLGVKGIEGEDWEWREVGIVNGNVFNVRVRDAEKDRFLEKATEKEKKDYGKSRLKKISLWDGFTYYFDLDAVRDPHIHDPAYKVIGQKDSPVQQSAGGISPQNPLGKNPGDVFEINTQPFPEAHFAVFPENLCEKPIKAGCQEGGIVLDPFCGAGTVCYVAREMKRQFIGIDIKKKYCKMTEKRMSQLVL